jgi:O-antigen ligase
MAGAALLCAVLDGGLLAWIRVGPPGNKGGLFFIELVLLLAVGTATLSAALLMPERARVATPFLFILLAWHTGFQIPLGSDKFVLTVFDVLIPLCVVMALVGKWYQSMPAPSWFQLHWKAMTLFWGFCVWGLVLAILRVIEVPPLLANLKSFVLYPIILILLPMCLRTWKQLYWAAGLMVFLVVERALDGLHEAATGSYSFKIYDLLPNGQLVHRIDGHMAGSNQYATYLVSGAMICLAIVAASRLKRTRVVLAITLGFIGLALLLTFSRGAWLGLAVAILGLIFILKPKRGVSVLAILVVIVVAVELLYPEAKAQFFSRAGQVDVSLLRRQEYYSLGFRVLQSFPLGAGWGAWFQRTPTGIIASPGFPWYHDDYLQLATEIGIPGLLVVLWIVGTVFMSGVQAGRRALSVNQFALCAGLTTAFLGMLVQTGTDQFLWHADIAPHIWTVGGLVATAAMLVQADRNGLNEEPSSGTQSVEVTGGAKPLAATTLG